MKKFQKLIYWPPRIFAILFAILLFMLSFDVFNAGLTPTELIVAFFMHNIPAFVLVAIIAIAWKWGYIGGLLFIGIGIFFLMLMWGKNDFIANLIVTGTPTIIGLLFILQSYLLKKR
jgi:hypothetical protein